MTAPDAPRAADPALRDGGHADGATRTLDSVRGRTAPGAPLELGPMPARRRMRTLDERVVRVSVESIFALACDVERWPALLRHYRAVRFLDRRADGGGIVEMAADRPFAVANWPTWWMSEMRITRPPDPPAIRFRHIGGITRGMEVEWTFAPLGPPFAPERAHGATRVRILHLWDGPGWPIVGSVAAVGVIGPVFVHGIASRTLAGLAAAAEAGR